MFGELGAALIDTDIIARDVVEPGTTGLGQVIERFGESVLGDGGRLDRRALRDIVFSDDEKRRDLEAILHPLIRAETMHQMQISEGPYQVIIIPLLVESPLKNQVDRVLVVDCNVERQLERLLVRDVESTAQAQRMIDAQSSREDRLALADDVIMNDGDIDFTRQQVAEVHQTYLARASVTTG